LPGEPGLLASGTQELCINFITQKGPPFKFETKAVLLSNPIDMVEAHFIAESAQRSKIEGIIMLKPSMIPNDFTRCRIHLIWYFIPDGAGEADENKAWERNYGDLSIENSKIELSIPFSKIRGNAFRVKMLMPNGGNQIITESGLCRVEGVPIYPGKGNPFDGLRVINRSKEFDSVIVRDVPKAANTTSRNLKAGEKIWILFDDQGNNITGSDLVTDKDGKQGTWKFTKAEINGAGIEGWIITDRFEELK
jgi:hypothetical protein